MATVVCQERRPLNFRVCSVFCNAVEYRVIFVHGVERGAHSNCQLYYRDDTGDMRTREHAVLLQYHVCSGMNVVAHQVFLMFCWMTVNSGLWESLLVLVLLQKWFKTRICRAHSDQSRVRSVVVADQTVVQQYVLCACNSSIEPTVWQRESPTVVACDHLILEWQDHRPEDWWANVRVFFTICWHLHLDGTTIVQRLDERMTENVKFPAQIVEIGCL